MQSIPGFVMCLLTEFFFIIKHILQCRCQQRRQLGGGSSSLATQAEGSGGSLGVTQRWRRQHDYETDDEAELMEENFGNKGEDDDAFGG
jgi:hypothetical protein